MAEPTVIREFLVALGYKVDEKGLKKFKDGVEDATKSVVRMVATIEGAAIAIGIGVAAFASKLEGLYFVSQRTGATVTSLKAVEFSAKNLGISAETARGSVEALARFMRNNPAGENYIKSLGVQTRNANGQLRDTVDIMADLGGELAKKPTYLATQYGNVLGIDENLLLAMRSGEFAKYLQQYREMAAKTGFDKAADDSHRFMVALRELGAVWDNFAARLESSLVQRLGPKLAEFQKWFEQNGPVIEQRVGDIALAIIAAAEVIGPVLGKLIDLFVDLDRATDGWSTKIIAGIAIFKVLGGFQLIGGILKMAAALRALGGAAAAAGAAAGAGGAAAGGGIAAGIAGLLSRFAPLARIGGALGLLFHSEGVNQGEAEDLAARRKRGMTITNPDGTTSNVPVPGAVPDSAAATGDKSLPRGLRNNNPGNIRYGKFAQSQGAIGRDSGGFAVFQSAEDGLRAMGALLRGYAKRGLNTVRGVINRWAPPSENDTGAYVDTVAKRLGVGEDQALNMSDPKVIAGLTAEMTRHENGRNPFSTDTILGAVGGGSRQASVTQNNQTSITVTGSSDPQATGRAVRDEQVGVNQELTRNMQGALS
ncbi:mannosyl-glycoprotein endo-beta-N-acetylglucosamidase [Pandoraea sputorum]|uniref:mannosyl-glycoprotein endo-beta-N-acetylglucosamidase n=1 Tax=Pandoraea sputorum TaxID=93222 RepID=UPI0012416A26|nr:mannosyl-glycoprotein endo-beta-N-acetylglucosamidase [Pandoraea sputorum]VVE79410.1 hypothetical protein PSP31120_02219 [Pandoraea sputorum]